MDTDKGKMTEEIEDDEINLLDYLIVLAKRKTLIISLTLGASIIVAIYSLFLSPIYKAETRILSPGKSDSSSLMLREVSNLVGVSGGAGGFSDPSVITGIIKSRTVYERIIFTNP